MKNDFDPIIKKAISDEVAELTYSEELFYKIKGKLESGEDNKKKFNKHYFQMNHRKFGLFAVCLLIICILVTCLFPNPVRALIKSIFVLEMENNKLQIVEKPATDVFITSSVGKMPTKLTNEELQNKLGFITIFPEKLCDGYRFSCNSLGVILKKPTDYETCMKLQNDMFNAIDDDTALNLLKPYNAVRSISGMYTTNMIPGMYMNIESYAISINVSKTSGDDIESISKELPEYAGVEINKVKIGELNGLWIKSPYIRYRTTIEMINGNAEKSVKSEIAYTYLLCWCKSDLSYSVSLAEDFPLTLEQAIKLAEDFMKQN